MKGWKITLVVLLIIVILAVLSLISLLLEQPWWLGPSIMIALGAGGAGAWFTFLGLKKFINWLWKIRPPKKLHLAAVSRDWKNAASSIRKSDLKEKGDPFYVLPWYLVIGESGAGKTTAILNSGLKTKIGAPPAPGKTKNCQWYFFEEAIVIDAPGRYVIHENDDQDQDEWGAFLKFFRKYRHKEPLNGVIITVAADVLLNSTHDELERGAADIWNSLQDIPGKLGVWTPIYLMVSKCDLIKGMRNFADLLPENKLSQAMGQINKEKTKEVGDFIDQTIARVVERLKRLRLSMSFYGSSNTTDASAFFFPEEFSKIRSGLKVFAEGIFKESIYEKKTILRGTFFTSAKQQTASHSRLLNNFKPAQKPEAFPEDEKSIFIRDLFGKIFTYDKDHIAPTRITLIKRRVFKFLRAAVVIVLIALTLRGVNKAYEANRAALSYIKMKKPIALGEDAHENINKLGAFLNDINELSARVENSMTPAIRLQALLGTVSSNVSSLTDGYLKPDFASWENGSSLSHFMLTQGKDRMVELKQKYCRLYRTHILSEINEKTENLVKGFHGKIYEEIIRDAALNLARRMNMLNSLENDKEAFMENIETFPRPDGIFEAERLGVDSSMSEQLKNQHIYYLLWADKGALSVEKTSLEQNLKLVLANSEISLKWIASFADLEAPVDDITLNRFWRGGRQTPENMTIMVPPSSASEGKEWMNTIIAELESAFPNSEILDEKIQKFNIRLRDRFFDSWQDFISHFEKGRMTLQNREEEYFIASVIGLEMDPHFALIEVFLANAPAFEEGEVESPGWVRLLRHFDDVRKKAAAKKSAESSNKVFAKTAAGKKLNKYSRLIKPGQPSADALNRYLEELSKVRAALIDSEFKLVKQTFERDGSSAFIRANKAFEVFKRTLPPDMLSLENKTIVNFLRGQFEYLWKFAVVLAGDHLQKSWDEQVVAEYYDIEEEELIPKLFGKQGYVRGFMDDKAKPFMKRNKKSVNFSSAQTFGQKIPFTTEFISFVRKGYFVSKASKKLWDVAIKSEPTELAGGKLSAYSTKLEIKNSKSTQAFENYQNVKTEKFTLDPLMKNAVYLSVQIEENIRLIKEYNGHYALSNFFNDFKYGSRVFYPVDFPYEREKLVKAGIKEIKVNLILSGDKNLFRLLQDMENLKPPKTIIL